MADPSMVVLTDEERKRVIAWMEWEAHTVKGMIGQMEKVGMVEAAIRINRMELAAFTVLLTKLKNTEVMSVGGAEQGDAPKGVPFEC